MSEKKDSTETTDVINNVVRKRHFSEMDFARSGLSTMMNQSYIYKPAMDISNEKIESLLQDPLKNYRELQRLSAYFQYVCPFYTNIIYHHASIMTYDYMIIPNLEKMSIKPETLKSRYMKASKLAKKTQVADNFTFMMFRTLANGEAYWYDLSDEHNTIFKEIPSKFCRRAFIDDDSLWRYYIDFTLLGDPSELQEMPREIQLAHESYLRVANDKKDKKRKIEGLNIEIPHHLYLVSAKGFSTSARRTFENHEYPFFANMFVDLNNFVNDAKYYNNFIKDENTKIIHMKLPTDPKTGLPIVDFDDMMAYHNAAKANVPSNVRVVTNPFELSGVDTNKSQQQVIDAIDVSKKNSIFGSGIASSIWEANTANELKLALVNDASRVKHLMSFFDNLMNYKLKEHSMLFYIDREITQYNKHEVYKQRKEGLGMGDLYTGWISAGAYEPYDAIMLAEMEKALDFESLFTPKTSAFQQSASDGEKGQPKKDEVSDGREESEGYE